MDVLPDDLKGEQKDVFFWDAGEWKMYSPGLGQNGGFGAEVSAMVVEKAFDFR